MTVAAAPIDRQALVARHAVRWQGQQRTQALQLGNGEFAFSADFTGVQSFARQWQAPLSTMVQWCWHREPNPQGWQLADTMQPHRFQGRDHLFPSRGWPHADVPAATWLNQNPHRFHLGDIGLVFLHDDGREAQPEDFSDAEQHLDLWAGTLHSRYRVAGEWVQVRTQVHPALDLLSVQVRSPLLQRRRVGVRLAWPGVSPAMGDMRDWERPERHHTEVQRGDDARRWRIDRRLHDTHYVQQLQSSAELTPAHGGTHLWCALPAGGPDAGDAWSFQVAFTGIAQPEGALPPPLPPQLPDAEATDAAVRGHWAAYWSGGAAVDFDGSRDSRAPELERRVVLSQYLMALQACGSLPPQETGLSSTSWYGKFHLEMHWWHAAHFAAWGRPQRLERSLAWYHQQLPQARAHAASLGLRGARWPKMVGPAGQESPGAISPFILWQQPHPIHFAELLWRAAPGAAVLERWREIVLVTADGLASTLEWDGHRYVLGPPVVPVQEAYEAGTVLNPAFELAYFHFGLDLAQQWRERLGLPRDAHWDHVLQHLAPLPVHDGVYVPNESHPTVFDDADACEDCRDSGAPLGLSDLFSRRCRNLDHPSFAGVLGFLPGARADAATMRRTLARIRRSWNLSKMWGWDYPFLAMSAARTGDAAGALDFLFQPSPVNQWGPSGQVRWNFLPDYYPANGALLSAVALMAGGWHGASRAAPGFPDDGSWQVRAEGFVPGP